MSVTRPPPGDDPDDEQVRLCSGPILPRLGAVHRVSQGLQ